MPNDDLEPGWIALSFLMRPIRACVAVKQWVHDLLHPEPPKEDRP